MGFWYACTRLACTWGLFRFRGVPLLMRVVTDLLKPKYGVPGFDVAGTVEAVGIKVTRFRPGDEVFGTCHGACAEYACAREDQLARKLANLTFDEAAAYRRRLWPPFTRFATRGR